MLVWTSFIVTSKRKSLVFHLKVVLASYFCHTMVFLVDLFVRVATTTPSVIQPVLAYLSHVCSTPLGEEFRLNGIRCR